MDRIISTIPLLEILTRYAVKHAVSFSGVESNAIVEAMQEYAETYVKPYQEKIKKMEFMIDNGLGWKDMINDITMPHEI